MLIDIFEILLYDNRVKKYSQTEGEKNEENSYTNIDIFYNNKLV